jgi:hypothetical protein
MWTVNEERGKRTDRHDHDSGQEHEPQAGHREAGSRGAADAASGDQVTERVPDAPSDNLDSMSLTEPRRLAVAQGWSTGTKGGKRDIIALLRKHPDGPPKSAKKAQPKPADDVESKPSAQVDPKRAREIGARMVELRKEYTRGVLAEAAQTTPSIIWRWEQGARR